MRAFGKRETDASVLAASRPCTTSFGVRLFPDFDLRLDEVKGDTVVFLFTLSYMGTMGAWLSHQNKITN